MIKFISVVIFVLTCFARLTVSSYCPTLGRSYSHSLHINWKENVGYHSLVEVVEGSYRRRYLVDDYFDGLTGVIKVYGRLNISDHQVSYHPSTNEGFILKDGECLSTDLSVSNQMEMVKQWTDFDYYSTVNATGQLGPNGLLTYLLHQINDLQYVEDRSDDLLNGHHWFTCLSPDGPYVYVHLDSFGSQLPRMVVKFPHPNSSYLTLNYIKLSPLIDISGPTDTYPYGYGCQRGLRGDKGRPRLGQSSSFILKMESVSFYSGHSAPQIISFNIFKSNGLFSYDIGQQEDGSYIRIIRDPNLSKDYTIDLSSGACSSINIMDNQEGCPKWPHNLTYDLISIVLDNNNGDDLSYLGQTVSESRKFDIYEKTVNLSLWQNSSAIVTYFYLVNSSANHNQLSRITIKPREDLRKLLKTYSLSTINNTMVLNGSSKITIAKESIYNNDNLQCPSLSKIEVRIIDYMEAQYLYDPVRFDLRTCITSEPNQSTWFQIVFSIVPQFVLSMVNRQSLLETELRISLNFIPFIRIPDIKVAHYGPSIYITVKLLDSFSLKNNNERILLNKELKDSTITILRSDDKNCAQFCFDSSNCTAYSYCSDGRCSILMNKIQSSNATETSDQIELIESPNCIVHLNPISKMFSGYWTSSTSLLHRIKSMITSRQLILSHLNLVADDMLIVSGSDELGSYGDLFEFDDSPTSNLNEYRIILSNHDLIKGEVKLTGLSYIDCLYHCQNDDNCLTVSYCNNNNGDNINSECVISSLSVYQVSSNSSNRYIEYNGKCNIMSRPFIHLFNLIPGKSWVTSAQRQMVNISLEQCAKTCLDGQSLVCQAFDFCTNSMQTFCYMHKFHIADDSIDPESGTTTQAQSKLTCNHYARKMSKDYKQFIGMQFTRSNDNALLTTIDNRSLENCASACHSDEKDCRSFEYCQFNNEIDLRSQRISSCRLSTYQVIGNSKSRLQPTKDFCSVYGIVKNGPKTVIKVNLNVSSTYINGLLCCLFGSFLGSILASYFLKEVKLTDKRNQELPLTRLN